MAGVNMKEGCEEELSKLFDDAMQRRIKLFRDNQGEPLMQVTTDTANNILKTAIDFMYETNLVRKYELINYLMSFEKVINRNIPTVGTDETLKILEFYSDVLEVVEKYCKSDKTF